MLPAEGAELVHLRRMSGMGSGEKAAVDAPIGNEGTPSSLMDGMFADLAPIGKEGTLPRVLLRPELVTGLSDQEREEFDKPDGELDGDEPPFWPW